MPRFFISLVNGENVIDEEGREFADLAAARRGALKAAGEIVADEMAQGRESVRITMIIEDEGRERVLQLPVELSTGQA